ncbi:hypothetical protein DFH08DRAFT_1010977 [Mycena albidolilacea]|uniref:Acetyl-CoA synthetase-like protein n=1 Tax=Mycena albidolilacea TaxID=1033008 RepID=A0AAD6ZW46_9AGAR|nr:hypothetical protein DFH08DRAFT_1010977 [Mycena albidolilacea]
MYIQSPYPALPRLPEVNVHNVMFGRENQAGWWPDYTIHIEAKTGRERTYKELMNAIAVGATALGASVSAGGLGLNGDGDEIIGMLGDNSLEYYDLVVSLLRITTPFALISTHSTHFELVHALKLTKATRIFVDPKLLKNVVAAIEDPDVHITRDKVYIMSGPSVHGRKSFSQMVATIKRKRVTVEPVRPATAHTLAYLVMSSGTSGLPKAVMITHGNIICSTFQGITTNFWTNGAQPVTTQPVAICPLPMFHTFGLHSYILRSTLSPTTYVILGSWNTTQYLKAISRYRPRNLTLVPSLVHQLLTHPDIKTTDFSSVVTVASGAAYLPPELAAQLGRYLKAQSTIRSGILFQPTSCCIAYISAGYGLSEATLGAVTPPLPEGMPGMGPPPPNTAGILLPGLEARIVRDDGTDAARGEVGELWLRGGNIAPGYWNNPEANAKTFVDGGWLRTGDQFRTDDKGYLFFADRAKDTLKISGVQVSPKEIEDVLLAQPDKLITDVSVAGVSGGRTSDEKVPRAWIVLSAAGTKKGEAAVIKILEAWHQKALSKYKWLRGGIEVVKEIPKTPTGKTMRRVLQDQYELRAKKATAKL